MKTNSQNSINTKIYVEMRRWKSEEKPGEKMWAEPEERQ